MSASQPCSPAWVTDTLRELSVLLGQGELERAAELATLLERTLSSQPPERWTAKEQSYAQTLLEEIHTHATTQEQRLHQALSQAERSRRAQQAYARY